jgi:hypothetical protein
MHSRTRSFLRAVAPGALLTPLLWLAAGSQAQTTVSTTTTATATTSVNSAVVDAQRAAARREQPVTPNLKVHNAVGLKTAVISATDTDANLQHARRALLAANVALARTPESALMPITEVAGLHNDRQLSYPYSIEDYQQLDKKGKIKRALLVTVGPGTSAADSASHTALVELFDTATGGLVGRGEGAFTATPANTVINPVSTAGANTPPNPAVELPSAEELELRAIDGAVFAAVDDMMQPAQLTGVVVTRPQGYQARISLGEISGLRNGSQIEYVGAGGQPVAYGTVISLGRGEALATVAPERAFPQVYVNMPIRTLNIPSAGRAGPTQTQLDDREWNSFERDFGISAAIAGGLYLLLR